MPGPIKALRICNLMIGGALTSSQLQTLLNDAATAGAFGVAMQQRTLVNAISANSSARSAVGSSGTALSAIAAGDMSTTKFVSGLSGADPARYFALTDVLQDSTVMTPAVSVVVAMNLIAANARARSIIGTSGAAWNAITGVSAAVGKYLIGLAGLDPTAYADMSAVVASSTAMTAISANTLASTAMAASSVAMTAVAGSSAAMAIVVASSTAMTAIAASSIASTAMAASSTAMTAVIGNSSALTTVINSSTAMTAIAANTIAKMAFFNSDTALNALAASATAMAAFRAAAQYALLSATENGTTSVSLAWAGSAYIVLGGSHNTTQTRTATISTRRTGSAIAATIATSGTSSTTGTDVNCAIPVNSAYSFLLNGTGAFTFYFGALRCDV